jgi:hypothetical protein
MTRTENATTGKLAGFGTRRHDLAELRKIAIAWLLTERAKLQGQLDRLDAELAVTITSDVQPDDKENPCGRRFH